MTESPTIQGLRLVFRRPLLGLAEVVWRWSFSFAALAAVAFMLIEYSGSLQVTRGDLILLRSGIPWLVFATLQRILLSGLERLAVAAAVMITALGTLWIVLASIGRTATIHSLLDQIGKNPGGSHRSAGMGALLGIHFLRFALMLATFLACCGAAILASLASPENNPQPALVFNLCLGLWCIGAIVWMVLDRLLSIAPIFAVRDATDTFGAVSAALRFIRQRSGPLATDIALFAVIHLAVFLIATSFASTPFPLFSILPGWIVILFLLVLTLLYFAAVDFLYVARLASYLVILNRPEEMSPPAVVLESAPPPPRFLAAHEDDILSDIPGIVPPEPA